MLEASDSCTEPDEGVITVISSCQPPKVSLQPDWMNVRGDQKMCHAEDGKGKDSEKKDSEARPLVDIAMTVSVTDDRKLQVEDGHAKDFEAKYLEMKDSKTKDTEAKDSETRASEDVGMTILIGDDVLRVDEDWVYVKLDPAKIVRDSDVRVGSENKEAETSEIGSVAEVSGEQLGVGKVISEDRLLELISVNVDRATGIWDVEMSDAEDKPVKDLEMTAYRNVEVRVTVGSRGDDVKRRAEKVISANQRPLSKSGDFSQTAGGGCSKPSPPIENYNPVCKSAEIKSAAELMPSDGLDVTAHEKYVAAADLCSQRHGGNVGIRGEEICECLRPADERRNIEKTSDCRKTRPQDSVAHSATANTAAGLHDEHLSDKVGTLKPESERTSDSRKSQLSHNSVTPSRELQSSVCRYDITALLTSELTTCRVDRCCEVGNLC